MEVPILADMNLTAKEYAALNAQAANYRIILRLLIASGLNKFLQEKKRVPLDITQTPDDTTGGESINLFLKSIADECNKMDQKIQSLSEALVDTTIALAKEKRIVPPKKQNKILLAIKRFIFVNP